VRDARRTARGAARGRVTAASVVALLLGGCLGGRLLASSSGSTHVESVPPGAEVFAMGEKLGTTPLDVENARVFPVDYPRELAASYGKIVLRFPGCEDLVRNLDLRSANEGITAKLTCTGASGESPADRAGPMAPGDRPSSAPVEVERPRSAVERLAEIESLRSDGLLDESESRALRERVLREELDERPAAEALRSLEALRAAGSVSDTEYHALREGILARL